MSGEEVADVVTIEGVPAHAPDTLFVDDDVFHLSDPWALRFMRRGSEYRLRCWCMYCGDRSVAAVIWWRGEAIHRVVCIMVMLAIHDGGTNAGAGFNVDVFMFA